MCAGGVLDVQNQFISLRTRLPRDEVAVDRPHFSVANKAPEAVSTGSALLQRMHDRCGAEPLA